jgi:hypothetical protein
VEFQHHLAVNNKESNLDNPMLSTRTQVWVLGRINRYVMFRPKQMLSARKDSQKGQGLIEYILVIMVVVSLIVAISVQLNASQTKGIKVVDEKVNAATASMN